MNKFSCSRRPGRVLRYSLTLTLAAVFVAQAGDSLAHARFKSSNIFPDAVVTTVPARLVVSFQVETSPEQTRLQVLNSAGKAVDKGDLKVDKDVTSVGLGILDDGQYTVKFRSFSEDDSGIVEGEYTFTVERNGAYFIGDSSNLKQAETGREPEGVPNSGFGSSSAGASASSGYTVFSVQVLLLLTTMALFSSAAGLLVLVRLRKRRVKD